MYRKYGIFARLDIAKKILHFFSLLIFLGVCASGSAYAAGYTCSTKKYTSCNKNYYLSECGTTYDGRTLSASSLKAGNSCKACTTAGSGYTCDGGLKCPAKVSCAAGQYMNNGTCTACPTGYTSAAGATSAADCYVKCEAGTRVVSPGATCTTPAGPWYLWGNTVYYGNVTPVVHGMSGFTNTSTTAADHTEMADLKYTIPAGKQITSRHQSARYVRISTSGNSVNSSGLHVVELQVFENNAATGTNLMSGVSAGSGTDLGKATDGNLTKDGGYAQGGNTLTWDMGSIKQIGSMKFYLYSDGRTYNNVTIYVSTDNTNWTQVMDPVNIITNHHAGNVNINPEWLILAGSVTDCAIGAYSVQRTVNLNYPESACTQCSTLGGGLFNTTASIGSKSSNYCLATITPGRYLASISDTTFTNCTSGYICPGGKFYYRSATNIGRSTAQCAVGSYVSTDKTKCTLCNPGYTTASAGSTASTACVKCSMPYGHPTSYSATYWETPAYNYNTSLAPNGYYMSFNSTYQGYFTVTNTQTNYGAVYGKCHPKRCYGGYYFTSKALNTAESTAACTACPDATYKSGTTTATSCSPCPKDLGWTVNNLRTTCTKTFTLNANGGSSGFWADQNIGGTESSTEYDQTCTYGYPCNFMTSGAGGNEILFPNDNNKLIDGWDTSPTCSSKQYEFTLAELNSMTNGATYYACKTYKVTFDLNGGTNNKPADVYATHGADMPALSTTANPTRAGYVFGGWYDSSATTGGTQYYTSARASARTWNKSTAPTTLYARWTAANNTITLNKNGGTGTCGGKTSTTNGSFTCTTGVTATLPSWNSSTCNITKTKSVFVGWGTSSTATTTVSNSFTCPTSNATYYAVWKTPTCVYRPDDGIESATLSSVNSSNQPVCSVVCEPGYSQAGGIIKRVVSFNVTGSTGATSVTVACKPTSSKIVFNANGGTLVDEPDDPLFATYDEPAPSVTKWGTTAVRAGYIFGGFYDTSAATGGTQYYTADMESAHGWDKTDTTVTLYARWTQCPDGTYAAAGATSCTACPTKDASVGWEIHTDGLVGGTSWASCYKELRLDDTVMADPICASGSVRVYASSATEYNGKVVAGDPLIAHPGGYVDTANVTCRTCAAGKYSAGGTVTSCSTCTTGTYSAEGASKCTACPAATDSSWRVLTDGAGATSWKACYEGKDISGTMDVNQPDNWCDVVYMVRPAISASAYGDVDESRSDILVFEGAYLDKSNKNDWKCRMCAGGTYSAGGQATSCSACASGTFAPAGASKCTTCPAGYAGSDGARDKNTTCYTSCAAKTITNGTTTVVNAKEHYNGTAYPACTFNVNCNAGYGAAGNKTTNPTCSQCANWTYSAGGTASCSDCPAATSGWSKGSGTGWNAVTQCYQVQTPANCASGQVKQNATSATAWGATTLLSQLKSKAGYYASSTATSCSACPAGSYCPAEAAAATTCAVGSYTATTAQSACTACAGGKTTSAAGKTSCDANCSNNTANVNAWKTATWSANTVANLCAIDTCKNSTYLNSNSCAACPAAESGWTLGTGTGWTAVTSCFETKAATAVSEFCSAGQLKKNATNATTWGASAISVPLQAKAGAIVSGQTCGQCNGAVWSAGGTATSCSDCPAQTNGWTRNTGKGWSAVTQCNQTRTPANCASGTTIQNATSTTAWGTEKLNTALSSKAGYYVNGLMCTACAAGKYYGGGTATSCEPCPAAETGWTMSTATALSQVTQCTETTTPATTNSPIATICTAGTLTKKATSATAWGAATASGLTAKAGRYVNGTTCTACATGTYTSAATTATSCTPAAKGYYVNGTEKTAQTACAAGTYTSSTGQSSCATAAAGTYTTGCQITATNTACTGTAVCATDTWSNAKASSCTACTTAKGYHTSGTAAANHDGIASCKATCGAGTYVSSAGGGCINVGAGYWGAGGTVAENATLGRSQCATGLTTIGYGPGADEAGDCGRILNLGGDNGKIYLRSVKKTTPSLNIKIDGQTFYGNMGTVVKGKLRVKKDSTTYSVYDDSM